MYAEIAILSSIRFTFDSLIFSEVGKKNKISGKIQNNWQQSNNEDGAYSTI